MSGKPKIGWDETESKEFTKAIKGQLFVQTPLQVILEALVSKIQSQALVFESLQKRMERIEARDMNSEELLARVKMCEDALAVINHEKLSPFHQQEVLVRLDEIEARVNNLPARGTSAPARDPSSSGASLHADHPHQPIMRRTSTRNLAGMGASNGPLDLRVAALEGKLAGVYNLNGKLMAVEALAAEMGVDIPDLEGVEGGGLPESMADASPRPGLGAASAAAEDVAGMMRGVSFHQGPAASSGEASTGLSPRGALLLDRMAASTSQPASRLGSPLGRGAAGGMGAQSRGTSPRNTARDPEAGLWPSVSGTVGTATSAHKQPLNMGSRLNETVAQLAQLQQEHQTLSSLVTQLQGEVGALSALEAKASESSTPLGVDSKAHQALEQRVEVLEVSSREMRENIMTEIAAVRKEAQRAPELTFADFTALSSRVEAVTTEAEAATAAVTELKEKVVQPLTEAVSDLKDQAKRAGEPRDMDTLFHSRLTKIENAITDLGSEVQMAVNEVLEDVARIGDIEALEEALDTRASQMDVRQLAMQQGTLAQSLNDIADWLAVRPETADGTKGTGSSATRFKCLTCDREIKGQSGSPASERANKGSFLPKLENMPGAHPGAPVGPGINAAEMRRLAEEKLGASLSRKGASPPKGAEFEEYGADRDKSPARARSGRVPIPMPNSALVPKVVPGAQRTPVFF